MFPSLYTERLHLRPSSWDDREATQAAFEQWEVVRYLKAIVPWPYPADGAESFFRDVLFPAMEQGVSYSWALIHKDDPAQTTMGAISLKAGSSEGRGFWLAPAFWGQGYMQEAADRVTDFAFRELNWERIATCNAAENVASSKIKQRQGFRLNGTCQCNFVSGRLASENWVLDRDVWMESYPEARPEWK